MAAESILTYKKPGFPKITNSEKAYQTAIEYVGPQATLEAAYPAVNATWGDYIGIVTGSVLSPIEGTTQCELTVTVEYKFDGSDDPAGEAREVTYEVEWVSFSRPLLEHPEFRIGGGGTYELDAGDVADLEAWKNAAPSLKGFFKFWDTQDESEGTLTANAEKFAEGLNLGFESYDDFAPVIRRTTTFAGGLPGDSEAGQLDIPPSFNGIPTGYEWRKSADRAVRTSGQTRWDRVEEWLGAQTVLLDKNSIYY